jgi:hypothetical protein
MQLINQKANARPKNKEYLIKIKLIVNRPQAHIKRRKKL